MNRAALAVIVLAGLAVGPRPAGGPVLGADGPDRIEGSYIVVARSADARAAVLRHGGQIRREYTAALSGFAVAMSERQARSVAGDPAVAYVEQDSAVRTHTDQLNPPSWGLDRIDQRSLPLNSKYGYTTTGAGVTAYVIDTGIRVTLAEFGGRAVHGTANGDDCWGHGTGVASIIGGTNYGVAKGVKLVAVQATGCGGSTIDMLSALDWVTANAVKPAVANMSMGSAKSTALNQAAERLVASGVTTVVAAGNEGVDACTTSPASTPGVITVGASTKRDARAGFSNWGSCVDVFSPGDDVAAIDRDGRPITLDGTSEATPLVAGAAALYLQSNPTATPAQVRDHLIGRATTGKLTGIGAGSPNRLLYTGR